MNMLANLATDASISNEKDSVGGGSRILESALYDLKVLWAYISKSTGGAIALNVSFKASTGQELRQQFWMTGGTAKGAKNFYEKDGEKHYLPGFIMANSLCLLTLGKEISQLETEQKVIPLYNAGAKSEVPTKVDMVTDLIGQEIKAGVIKQTVDKNKKNEATGQYEPTGETREENEIDKFFRMRDSMTTTEIRAQAEAASFVNTWKDKWNGVSRDKSTGTAANKGNAGLPTAKASAGPVSSAKPATSLFA